MDQRFLPIPPNRTHPVHGELQCNGERDTEDKESRKGHGDDLPIVVGIFEQIAARLICESTLLAVLLRPLGYFGPMSLDPIVADDGDGDYQVHGSSATAAGAALRSQ